VGQDVQREIHPSIILEYDQRLGLRILPIVKTARAYDIHDTGSIEIDSNGRIGARQIANAVKAEGSTA
jgi:hypothetical protein